MKKYTDKELDFINSFNKPIDNIDMNLVNSILNKMLLNGYYEDLINFLNDLYDFAEIPNDIVDKLISEDNKKCVSVFLENENQLYFLNDGEKDKLKAFLDVREVNVKLSESYDYYYKLLFEQKVRNWKSVKIDDNVTEYTYIRYNKPINLKLREGKDIGVIVSCVLYANYDLSKEEQVLKEIDYLNEYGFNIERNINNDAILN